METSDVSFRKKYYIYVLFSFKDKKFYIGFTEDLKRRLTEHAAGLVSSTRARRPLKLIHYEYFIDKSDAKAREVFLKSGFGRNQLKEALKRTLTELNYEAPRADARGIFSFFGGIRRSSNSHSSSDLRPRFSAKADKNL